MELVRDREIILTDMQKMTLLDELTENSLWYFMRVVKSKDEIFNNGIFTDDEKVEIAASYAHIKDEKEFENNSNHMGRDFYSVNINYLQIYVTELFNYTIDTAKISLETLNDKITVSIPAMLRTGIFKIDKLLLNEITNTYYLYIDDVRPERDEIYNESGLNVALDFDKGVNYTKSKVPQSYILEYKETNGNKYFISLSSEIH